MSKIVEKETADALWGMVSGPIRQQVEIFAKMGIKPLKGETKAEATAKVWMGLLEDVYRAGLNRGYDMGYSLFDPTGRAEALAARMIADDEDV